MAVLSSCPGLTVAIFVKGQALPEYDGPDGSSEQNKVVKFVETQAGEEFEIQYKFDQNFPTTSDVLINFWIDGERAERLVIAKTNLGLHWIKTLDKKVASDWFKRTLRFNDIQVVDDLDSNLDVGNVQEEGSFGELKLAFELGTIGGTAKRTPTSWNIEEQKKIHESVLKGDSKSLHVSLGNSTPIQEPPGFHWRPKKKRIEYLAEFCFKYRTKTNLRALHILPQISDPMPIVPPEPGNVTPSPDTQSRQTTPQHSSTQALANTPQQATQSEQVHLRAEDMIPLIKHYRGDDHGLQGLPAEELSVLLNFYRNKSRSGTTFKRERTGSDPLEVHIKRETNTEPGDRRKIKREKTEIVILDD